MVFTVVYSFSTVEHQPILGHRPNIISSHFLGRWTEHGASVLWPVKSPFQNPLDFFIWEHLKELVYQNWCDIEDMVAKLHAALLIIGVEIS
jgi:hypothetical protein